MAEWNLFVNWWTSIILKTVSTNTEVFCAVYHRVYAVYAGKADLSKGY